jgi:hypothetical protein
MRLCKHCDARAMPKRKLCLKHRRARAVRQVRTKRKDPAFRARENAALKLRMRRLRARRAAA